MRQQQPFYQRIATKMNVPSNPFRLGDKVQFVPNERAQGWSWFGPRTIQPNDIGVVSSVQDSDYLYIKRIGEDPGSPEVGGFHWQCFRRAD
jgi:hypothetical protein